MLTPHRRHRKSCDHREKGWNFTLCDCPVWCDGTLNGDRFTKSLGTTNWERAVLRIQALESGRDLIPDATARYTVERAVKAFLKDAGARNLAEDSITSYRKTLEAFAATVGKRDLSGVSTEEIGAHLDKRKLGPRTRRKEIEYLRALYNWCIERDWCTKNPAKRLRLPEVDDVATLPFTRDEVSKLLQACTEMQAMWKKDRAYVRQRARALVLALVYSGLRIGDVARLQRAALASSGHLTLRTTKTGAPVKVLLHPDAAAALRSLPAPGGNPKYFFWSGNGGVKHCAKSLGRTIARLGKLAGLHAHPHRFRDTFAVELLTKRADIRTVQQLLGHSSVRITEKHYAHFVVAHQEILDSATAQLDFTPEAAAPLLVHPLKKRRRNP